MLTRQKFFDEIVNLCFSINTKLSDKFIDSLKQSLTSENNELAKKTINEIIENNILAQKLRLPTCQDTGVCVYFLEIGKNAQYDFDLQETINEATRYAYEKFYFRKSIVKDPINRINTNTNTPCIIHYEIVKGNQIKLSLTTKGAGSENMSDLKMLGLDNIEKNIIDFTLETIKKAGGKACPPLTVGIGIGGSFEYCAFLAKKALIEEDLQMTEQISDLAKKIKDEINKLNIGPMGYGGKTTCLEVKIKSFACHIASLPVAINLNCHASRHKTIIFDA